MDMDRIPLGGLWAPGPIEQNRASDNAVHYLRSLVFSGQLGPGDRLPSERELARQLSLSTLTVRAALRYLEAARFLVVTHGSKGGWRVNDADTVSRCWQDWMRDRRGEVDDLLEFQWMVDSNIAALAAERRTAEDLEALERFGSGAEDQWTSVRWHTAFHDALARATHNLCLEWATHAIRAELFLPVRQAISEHRMAEIRALHDRILSAVRDRDPGRASAEIWDHHELTKTLFTAVLRE